MYITIQRETDSGEAIWHRPSPFRENKQVYIYIYIYNSNNNNNNMDNNDTVGNNTVYNSNNTIIMIIPCTKNTVV